MQYLKSELVMKMIHLFFIPFTLSTYGQITPPCGNDYGSPSDRDNIQQQMFTGTALDVENAINQAKNTRGTSVGCPQTNYGPFTSAITTQASLSSIENVWNTLYAPYIQAYTISCPEIARGWPRYGLAALYARQAGYYPDLNSVKLIGEMLEAQQYSDKYAPTPLVTYPGLFGYYNGPNGDPCQLPGVAGTGVSAFCSAEPTFCVTYDAGLYSGSNFATNDHVLNGSTVTGDIGGAGYDQGWAVTFMIENAIQQTDAASKLLFKEAATLGGEWAMQHPLVTNHNYTAKNVWLLAQLYEWSGRSDFKNALIDRLERNLRPGVLTDWDNDGLVDGMSPAVSFTDLYQAAQIPGRNWDAHNSQPWYQSMNAWAMLEAYCAFRDRGDLALASQYKPYVTLMLDNLANEVLTYGTVATNQTGWSDTPHALLLGVWKLAMYENETHQNWVDAIWAYWNSGAFNIQGDRGINVPLYLLIKTQTPYVPFHMRDDYSAKINELDLNSMTVHPNPSAGNFTVGNIPLGSELILSDMSGKEIYVARSTSAETIFHLEKIEPGLYLLNAKYLGGSTISKVIVE